LQPKRFERTVDGFAPVAHLIHTRDEVEILADGQVFPIRKPLRHIADVALDLRGLALDVVAEAGAGAGVRREQSAHEADRRGLAAAVRTEKAKNLAARDLQRHVVDHVLVAKVLVQVMDVDRVSGRIGVHFTTTVTGCPG
jgi:hypothetical protein